jgi:hypothetical protein
VVDNSNLPPMSSVRLSLISYLRFSDKLPTAEIIKTPKKIDVMTILNSLKDPLNSLNESLKKIKLFDKNSFNFDILNY